LTEIRKKVLSKKQVSLSDIENNEEVQAAMLNVREAIEVAMQHFEACISHLAGVGYARG
jgi:hypothetical protein